jgi:hypothetical protein
LLFSAIYCLVCCRWLYKAIIYGYRISESDKRVNVSEGSGLTDASPIQSAASPPVR